MSLSFEPERIGDILVCRLTGRLSTFMMDHLRQRILLTLKKDGVRKVLLNMEQVDYLTSKDLGGFIQIYRFLIDEYDKDPVGDEPLFALSNLSPFVTDVIEMTKLGSVFRIFKTEAEAVKALSAANGVGDSSGNREGET
jgi:stage II sporulation protein AA (anti-sigma F factor antagonist)